MKLLSIVFAIPWVLVLIGLSEIYLGVFSRLAGGGRVAVDEDARAEYDRIGTR